MGLLERLSHKIRHGPALRLVFDGLSHAGIRIRPYYLVSESLPDKPIPRLERGFEEYQVGFLEPKDMDEIAAMRGQIVDRDVLCRRLAEGSRCLAARHGGRIVAFTWYRTDRAEVCRTVLPIADGEVYLYDTYTLPAYRGRGLAPYIRYRLYQELARIGARRLLSVTEYGNDASFRFKRKLNARPRELRCHVSVFNRWERDGMLKRYRLPA